MEDEKSFKDKQLKSSEATMRRLHQDKEKRLQEMEKVKTLDEKVAELACTTEKRSKVIAVRTAVLTTGLMRRGGAENEVVHVCCRFRQ